MTTQIPAIPAGLGDGGAYLAKGGGAGSPDLPTLLAAMRTAILELQGQVPTQDAGANLPDAAATIERSDGQWRKLPAGTLTAARVLTLGVADSPVDGAQITITRLDTTANTYTIANGGTGGGNIFVFPVSKTGSFTAQFNGTSGAWEPKSFGLGS